MNLPKIACFVFTIAAVAIAFFVFPVLPATVPTHWDAAGEIDSYGPAWMGAFLFPAVMAFVLLLFVVVPKIAVFKENLKAFEKQYWLLGFALQLFFLVFYGVTLLPNFNVKFNFSLLFTLPLAFLFIALGLLMPSFKRNFFVGIRTPWTLASDAVWEKTHRLGGKLFVVSGILALLLAFFPGFSVLLAIGPILAAATIVVVYSLLLFRKMGKRQL